MVLGTVGLDFGSDSADSLPKVFKGFSIYCCDSYRQACFNMKIFGGGLNSQSAF